MSWDGFVDIISDALKDSALVFLFVLAFHVLISFFDDALAGLLVRRRRTGPLLGSLFGLIPQCGTSVLGADLYARGMISAGTLIAVFLSCSDEALVILFGAGAGYLPRAFAIMGLKLVIGTVVGLAADGLLGAPGKADPPDGPGHAVTCTHRHHEEHVSPLHDHLLHPVLHALEIFAYVLAVNLVLGLVIGLVGEDSFAAFVSGSRYFAPVFSALVGLIPNCASSVLLAELYLSGALSFGALLGGLLVNAGLGMMVLLRGRKSIRGWLRIPVICFTVSIVAGYIACALTGF
ncbi:MAG: arsenic efflux protein [Spirochaetales bacterium]|nr:arsenic efflux protein [Spirochaetales bacterium]